jgi:hypothetical protein
VTTAEQVEGLVAALDALADSVRAVEFDLPTPDRDRHRVERDRIAADISGHAARLRHLEAPLLVVVGGVTGAGKSTFVNTMLGRDALATGPVRPTTSVPALVCHPDDARWFTDDRVLPGLVRVEASQGEHLPAGGDRLRLIRTSAVPPGLAIIDSPDIDSVAAQNRQLADALLDSADLWLWFTSAGKYADEDSMRYLRRARDRRTALAVVLTQVHSQDAEPVLEDFRRKLTTEGLANAHLFTIPVATVSAGRLPSDAVAPVRDWMRALAGESTRRVHRMTTLQGALDVLKREVSIVTDALSEDLRVSAQLLSDVDRAYGEASSDFGHALEEGLALRGEVIARWDRFVGAGRFLKATEAATGQARAWIKTLMKNVGLAEEQRLERQVRVEVADQISAIAGDLADLAAAGVVERWAAAPAGRVLLADAETELTRRSASFDERAVDEVRSWQASVAERVATVGAQRRLQARVVSGAISVAATSAILVALAHAGLTGAEAGIAAAAGAANQGLLVKLLGEANLRSLVGEARRDLVDRFGDMVAPDRQRFRSLVAEAAPEQEQLTAVRAALDAAVRAAPVARTLQG